MKRLSLLIFFALSSSLYGSGFDSAILWIYDIPDGSSDFFSTETMKLCDRRFQTSMLYSKPYGIGAVDWNNVFVRKGFGRWGAFARFNSYGLRDYYSRYIYNVGAAIKMRNSLSVSFDGQYHFEHFDRIGGFGRSELNARFSYYRGTVYSVLGLSGIRIDEDYKSSSGGARAWGALTYLLKNGMSFSGSVKRFENGRNRWLFSQHTRLSADVGLSFGVINRPDVIFGQLVLSRGSFSINLAYYSISRLGDSVVLGFAVGG